MASVNSGTVAAAAIDLQRQREQAASRERLARYNAEEARRQDERRFRAEEDRRRHEREQAAYSRRAEAAANRARLAAATASRTTGYTQFTPPQSFIAGGAATRISGAPSLLDVLIVLSAAAASGAWVVTRDHSTGADLGWAAFLDLLGVGLAVEGHGELHDVGVGLLGSQTAYLTMRLLGGTQQP